jgi:hypothetical protein
MTADITPNRIEQIRAAYDEPGLGRSLAAINADAARRATSMRAPDSIITASSFEGSRKDFLLSPVKGSIMLFWGRSDSNVISRLERAYASGDDETLRELSAAATRQMEDHPVGTLEDGVEAVLSSAMYFDVLYGSKELAGKLTLPDGIEYGAIAFPYNGGVLEDKEFRLVQRHRDGETLEYRTLVVKVRPDLTEIEREALDAVPIDQSFINIGEASICPAATVALVAIVVALVTQAGIWEEMRSRLDEVSLSASQIERLGPLASARELVAVRREIFEEQGF